MSSKNYFDSFKKTYIIAEIGVNHNGNIELAKKLINCAVKSGANAVKFQSYNAEKLANPNTPKVNYQVINSQEKNETHFQMLKKYELSKEEHILLKNYCDDSNIDFLSTPYDVDNARFLNNLDVKMFKTASADIVDFQLHRYISSTYKPVIISTGMSNIKEIKSILEYYDKEKNSIILLHCVSNYPCSINSVNLNSICFLRDYFKLPVGYSDHSSELLVPLLSIALNSKVIEKHFTLDKSMKGPDHKASSTPDEFANLVKQVRKSEKILGNFSKEVKDEEFDMRMISRKSIYLNKKVLKSQVICEDDFMLRRPGVGLNPLEINNFIGKKYKITKNKGDLLTIEDIL